MEPQSAAQTTAQTRTESMEDRQAIRDAVRTLCKDFPGPYWRAVDKEEKYPEEFVSALTKSGYLAALIPEEYGGAGLGITEASIILEEINHSGGNSGACHAQMYTMGTLLRHGSEEQKRRYLPAIARGELRLQAFAVTEPNAGSETTRIETRAVRKGDSYVVNGQKIFISRVKQSDLMLLLARTTPYDELKDKTRGLSVFIVDMRSVKGKLDGIPLHHRRLERRAHPDRRRGHRRWPLVHRASVVLCARPRRLRAAHRRESGHPVPYLAGLRAHRGRGPDALPCRRQV
jgi:alkylation response protein AidB-like acyl-CoA dehydrogenase